MGALTSTDVSEHVCKACHRNPIHAPIHHIPCEEDVRAAKHDDKQNVTCVKLHAVQVQLKEHERNVAVVHHQRGPPEERIRVIVVCNVFGEEEGGL